MPIFMSHANKNRKNSERALLLIKSMGALKLCLMRGQLSAGSMLRKTKQRRFEWFACCKLQQHDEVSNALAQVRNRKPAASAYVHVFPGVRSIKCALSLSHQDRCYSVEARGINRHQRLEWVRRVGRGSWSSSCDILHIEEAWKARR